MEEQYTKNELLLMDERSKVKKANIKLKDEEEKVAKMARQKAKLQNDYDEGQNQQQRLKQMNDEKECTIMALKQEIENLNNNQNRERK